MNVRPPSAAASTKKPLIRRSDQTRVASYVNPTAIAVPPTSDAVAPTQCGARTAAGGADAAVVTVVAARDAWDARGPETITAFPPDGAPAASARGRRSATDRSQVFATRTTACVRIRR